ncbi:guanylate kinase [Virgibacillus necropolis]|uniref:Guanylate kinase n=1 Tax=Virgibacillus necropolis TaxID=163877 RepID=A0A221MGJ9_9BACI|nr:guanylate kinase [Virgibacillus necropolis]ASN06765.1 guanylate kinase [Virgibacillus necropolis]
MNGKIIVLSGFSGVGKNTIINSLRGSYPSLVYIPSMTTRDMREGESEGFPYFFVSKEEFKERIEKNYFIEYEGIHGNWYGTPKDKYYEAIQQNLLVIKDIDVNGAISMKEEFGKSTILVYVEPPSIEELKQRLIDRGDDMDDIIRRLKRVDFEASKKPFFDETVVNDQLENAIRQCEEVIVKYVGRLAPSKHVVNVNKLLPTVGVRMLNLDKVNAIKEAVLNNDDLPLPIIYKQNGQAYIIDGHHRGLGYYAAGIEDIEVDMISGDNLKGYNIDDIHSLTKKDYDDWEELLKDLKVKS